jgi:molecular chaperone GrpE
MMTKQETSPPEEEKTMEEPCGCSEENSDDEVFESAKQPKQVTISDIELKALQKELMDYKDKYLRQLADAENARRRMQKEKHDIVLYATEKLVIDFLKPIDHFENALGFAQNMSEDVKNWAFGFQMILAQFKDALSQHGIKSIDSVGKEFNPHEHEAVEVVESNTYPPHTVVEECTKGYKMGDRIIRAARVKVSGTEEEKEEILNKK